MHVQLVVVVSRSQTVRGGRRKLTPHHQNFNNGQSMNREIILKNELQIVTNELQSIDFGFGSIGQCRGQ